MKTYCVFCKKKTDNKDIKYEKTKNNHTMMISKCKICNHKKTSFVANNSLEKNLNKKKIITGNQKGDGPIDFVLNNLPFPEMHLTDINTNGKKKKYNFCGPFTKLEKRLQRGDKEINELDEACKVHDIAYSKYKKANERNIHDLQLARIAEKISQESNISESLKKNVNLVSSVMRGKIAFKI